MDILKWNHLKELLNEDLFQDANRYIHLRAHQMDILNSMVEKFKDENRFLCEMAPGSGKTVLLAAALKILLKAEIVKKTLIVVDRQMQCDQLLDVLNEFLPHESILHINKVNVLMEASVVICTSQFICKEDKYKNIFNQHDVDLIVFFDLSQHISGKLLELGNYFDCYKLGIIDTKQFIYEFNESGQTADKKLSDTYNFFGRDVGNPDAVYSLSYAVSDMSILNPINTTKSIDIGDDLFDMVFSRIQSIKQMNSFASNNYLKSTIITLEFLLKNIENKSKENKELVEEFIKSGITTGELKDIAIKKEQLSEFEKLLNDSEYFNNKKLEKGSTEKVWQDFFEFNSWIFGYGLNFIFTSSLNGKKLEQVVAGYNFNTFGKRIDALMITQGLINSLVFVEIKCHNTKLLASNEYRSGCWQISNELAGAVSQIQKTVQRAVTSIRTKTELVSHLGDPTGDVVYLYDPKSFIVIGNLNEFNVQNGTNEDKFSSFELFRRSLKTTEIITFDELYNRAKFIIGSIDLE